MNEIDPNYRNRQSYLTTWVNTHNLGKNHYTLFQLVEVIAAIALVVLVPLMASELLFLAVGLAFVFYAAKRAAQPEKQIYVLANTHLPHSAQRDLQIYIRSVSDKIARANKAALEAEKGAPLKNFEEGASHIMSSEPSIVTVLERGRPHSYKLIRTELDDAIAIQCKGRKSKMEDLALGSIFDVRLGGHTHTVDVKAVFDGHNGTPKIKNSVLRAIIKTNLEKHNNVAFTETATFNALKFVMLDLNELFDKNGSTAVIALQIKNRLWVANTGDSRAFVIEPEGGVVPLTVDARVPGSINKGPLKMDFVGPTLVRGGVMDAHHIINGQGVKTQILRSLGDHHQCKTARPKITTYELPKKGKALLVMGSDGVFDKGRTCEIASFIKKHFKRKHSPSGAAARTIEMALASGVKDNLTCLVKTLNSDINIDNEEN